MEKCPSQSDPVVGGFGHSVSDGAGVDDVDDVDDNDDRDKQSGKQETEKAGEKGTENDGESAMEVDDDTGFLTHRLYFPKDNNEEIEKAECIVDARYVHRATPEERPPCEYLLQPASRFYSPYADSEHASASAVEVSIQSMAY